MRIIGVTELEQQQKQQQQQQQQQQMMDENTSLAPHQNSNGNGGGNSGQLIGGVSQIGNQGNKIDENNTQNATQQYTIPGILHYIQHEWARFEMERSQWDVDRAELQVRLSYLILFINRFSTSQRFHNVCFQFVVEMKMRKNMLCWIFFLSSFFFLRFIEFSLFFCDESNWENSIEEKWAYYGFSLKNR
jgi:hypothetical protein